IVELTELRNSDFALRTSPGRFRQPRRESGLVVIELKKPGVPARAACDESLTHYKQRIDTSPLNPLPIRCGEGSTRCLSRPLMPLAPTFHPTMQSPAHPMSPEISRRSFLKASAVLAGSGPLLGGVVKAQSAGGKAPLMAYVGTFSSPLRDVLPTQVDLPPGNGRGIHRFHVNRAAGALTPAGIH